MKDKKFITEKKLDSINHECFLGNCTYKDLVKIINLEAEKWHKYKLKKFLLRHSEELNKFKK